ncbi:MAG: hypothetical protein ABTD50_24735, partial [Polyangiaceae bacterium]
MSLRVTLVPDHAARGFIEPLPEMLNARQECFAFDVAALPDAGRLSPLSGEIDVAVQSATLASCKTVMGLRDEDLIIWFTSATLSFRQHGVTNLFAAGSSLSERPPRVAQISTRFIRRDILPPDPSYHTQRHAL